MTHTPGPWKIVTYDWVDKGKDGDWAGEITGPDDEKVYAGAASFHAINSLADAALIAAAPDLLAACNDALEAICAGMDSWMMDELETELRSVVVKAKGNTCD